MYTLLFLCQFSLCAERDDCTLVSVPLKLPLAEASDRTDGAHTTKAAADPHPLRVVLRSDQEYVGAHVIGELLLSYHWQPRTLVATIKPSYILHNRTSTELAVWPCLLEGVPGHNVRATCLQRVPPGHSQELIFWQNCVSGSGGQHAIAFHSIEDEEAEVVVPWSTFLSPNFVRRSFSLPTLTSSSLTRTLTPALLTMHEADDMTYLVVSCDTAPRIQFQNLCGSFMEVVESGTTGIHVMPEVVPPGELVVYEPPTLSGLYPLVYDEQLSSNDDKKFLKAGKQLSIRLRARGDVEAGEYEWSEPFPLSRSEDRIMAIPGMGGVLVTSLTQGASTIISILPTGRSSPSHPQPVSSFKSANPQRDVRIEASFAQMVVCLDSETSDSPTVSEVLRMIADDALMCYVTSELEGTEVKVTIQSLRIDNLLEKSTSEYAVMLLPRVEHARRASLIESVTPPLVKFSVRYSPYGPNHIDRLYLSIHPFTLQLEDSLLHTLKSLFATFGLPGVLHAKDPRRRLEGSEGVRLLPEVVRLEAERDANPLVITSLVIEPISFYLNARISLKVLLSCSDSPFRLPRYQLEDVYSNWTEVSQILAARYTTSVVMHIGWLLGSLELIGSPASFLQSVGRGLRDLVTLPYEGLTRSPAYFLLGIGHGTTAFLRHFSGGALRSMTNLASSLSQNVERLSMDPDHVSYQIQQRRERPVTHFTSGLATGVSSFGLSLMSAVAGIVEQPMQSFHRLEESASVLGATRGVLAGVGKGLVGVVTKPVGGAMELVSQTGQGIMHGTGLAQRLTHKSIELQEYIGPFERASLPPTTTRCAM